mmetsp:Transcript_106765/g.227989  ORF Transcript_106765/g.227989 Transcript_106765/m.227989 type:complete len:249 (+) Transcript_106765:51-797(+)
MGSRCDGWQHRYLRRGRPAWQGRRLAQCPCSGFGDHRQPQRCWRAILAQGTSLGLLEIYEELTVLLSVLHAQVTDKGRPSILLDLSRTIAVLCAACTSHAAPEGAIQAQLGGSTRGALSASDGLGLGGGIVLFLIVLLILVILLILVLLVLLGCSLRLRLLNAERLLHRLLSLRHSLLRLRLVHLRHRLLQLLHLILLRRRYCFRSLRSLRSLIRLVLALDSGRCLCQRVLALLRCRGAGGSRAGGSA